VKVFGDEKSPTNPSPPIIPGWYVGTCTNTTAGLTDNLVLTVYGVTPTTLHGELALAGVLGGGSPFQGTIANGQIRFTTIVPSAQLAVIWQAVIADAGLSGSYVVRCDRPEVKLAHHHQQGVWGCKLVRPMEPPNPDDAHRIWVYHNGVEEGPINREDFNRGMLAGQWPANAIVGLNDQTTWSTIATCLEKLQAEVAIRN